MKLVTDNTNKMMRANIRSLTAGGENDHSPINDAHWNKNSLITRFTKQAFSFELNGAYVTNKDIAAFQDLALMSYDTDLISLSQFADSDRKTNGLRALLDEVINKGALETTDQQAFRLMVVAAEHEDLVQQTSVMANHLKKKDASFFTSEEQASALMAYLNSDTKDIATLPNTKHAAANDRSHGYAYSKSA